MKTRLLGIVSLLGAWTGSLGQGVVYFANNPYDFSDSIENGGTAEYKIFKALDQLVDDPTWQAQLWEEVGNVYQPIGAPIPFWGVLWPGVWNVDADPLSGGRALHVPGGVQTTLEVRIFDGNGTLLGQSAPFSYTPCSGPPCQWPTMDNFRGFIVPEPSFGLLCLLGIGLYCFFSLTGGPGHRAAPSNAVRAPQSQPDALGPARMRWTLGK